MSETGQTKRSYMAFDLCRPTKFQSETFIFTATCVHHNMGPWNIRSHFSRFENRGLLKDMILVYWVL